MRILPEELAMARAYAETHDFARQLHQARQQLAEKAVRAGDDAAARKHLTKLLAADGSEALQDRSRVVELWREWAVARAWLYRELHREPIVPPVSS